MSPQQQLFDRLRPFLLIGFAALMTLGVFFAALQMYGSWSLERENPFAPISNGYCNIAVIPIQGDIVAYDGFTFDYGYDTQYADPIATSGDWVWRYVRDAQSDPNIRGILAEIDSYGGVGAASLQMMSTFKRSPLPVVAYIREAGTSAAYTAATGADRIIASPLSSVGSIGVTQSYVENSLQNEKEGLRFVQLSSGKFKDAGNPNKALTQEERALYERDLKMYSEIVVQTIATNRNLPVDRVTSYADGAMFPASIALERGLIDAVGDEETAREWFAEQLAIPVEEVVYCR